MVEASLAGRPTWRRLVGDYLAYLAARAAICLLQMLPLETYGRLAPWFARLCADRLKLRQRTVDENLWIAYPQLNEAQRRGLARQMWEHLFLLVGEVALAGRKIHATNWRETLRLIDGRRVVEPLLSGRPVVIVSGHFGNFELGNFLFGVLGVPTLAVARALDNPFLDRWLRGFRSHTGQRMVDKNQGYDEIMATLERGGALSLLADQYAGRRGCWVDFFGRPASTHKAVALFSLHHEAPLVVASARRLGKPLHYEVRIHAVFDPRSGDPACAGVRSLTQAYTTALEQMIRADPAQYWWVHRRWKDPRQDPAGDD